MVELWCVIIGEKESSFSVDLDLDLDQSVRQLKKAIDSEKKGQITCDADDLDLFIAKQHGRWLSAIKNEQYFGESFEPKEGDFHVLVVVPPDRNKKRKLADLADMITPSSFVRCKGGASWVKWLRKLDGQIERHRIDCSDDETPLPLVLLNETFARFEQSCKSIEVTNKVCEFVVKLCRYMSAPYENEAALAEKARGLLTDYLLPDDAFNMITPAVVDGRATAAEIRPCRTYIKNLPKKIDRQFPCFLVDICGPLLSVFCAMNTSDEDVICEPLVMSYPLMFIDNDWLVVSLARVCASLKAAMAELIQECYRLAAITTQSEQPTALNRLRFPYKDSAEINGAKVTLEYVEKLHGHVFAAEDNRGNELIVKFAKRYGKEVHEHCANAGFAPALLYHKVLSSGWVFVIMERLSLKSLARPSGSEVRNQLLQIKNILASAALVHGDLRESNVMWDSVNKRVVLNDFDWAGRDGVAMYPPFMNSEIAWPQGAETGKPLRWLDIVSDWYCGSQLE